MQVPDNSKNKQSAGMIYDVGQFSIQLKRIRIFKGYPHQCSVANKPAVSRQVFSLWELGRRLPAVTQLVDLAVFFQVDIRYFFTADANPAELGLMHNSPGEVQGKGGFRKTDLKKQVFLDPGRRQHIMEFI